jgi:hypothetical protein
MKILHIRQRLAAPRSGPCQEYAELTSIDGQRVPLNPAKMEELRAARILSQIFSCGLIETVERPKR